MPSSNNANPKVTLSQFVKTNRQDFVLILFIGHCALLGKTDEEKKKIIENYSSSSEKYLKTQKHGKYFRDTATLQNIIKEGLKVSLTLPFETILKTFIQKNVQSNLSSLSTLLLIILKTLNRLERTDYCIDRTMLGEVYKLEFNVSGSKPKTLSDTAILTYVAKRPQIELPPYLNHLMENKTLNELFDWASSEDKKTDTMVKTTTDRYDNKITTLSKKVAFGVIVAYLLATLLIMRRDIAEENNLSKPQETAALPSDKNVGVTSLIMFVLTILGICTVHICVPLMMNKERKRGVDSYKNNATTEDQSIKAALGNFFNLQLIKYQLSHAEIIPIVENENQSTYSLILTPQSESYSAVNENQKGKHKITSVEIFSNTPATMEELESITKEFNSRTEEPVAQPVTEAPKKVSSRKGLRFQKQKPYEQPSIQNHLKSHSPANQNNNNDNPADKIRGKLRLPFNTSIYKITDTDYAFINSKLMAHLDKKEKHMASDATDVLLNLCNNTGGTWDVGHEIADAQGYTLKGRHSRHDVRFFGHNVLEHVYEIDAVRETHDRTQPTGFPSDITTAPKTF